MKLFKLLSRLLDYPQQEVLNHLPELHAFVEQEPSLGPQERASLLTFMQWMQSQQLLALEAEYVQTFDMTAEHSLHLTHHLFGDDRGRGPALVDLGEHYKSHGFDALGNELPDYLPLILEFVSTLDELQAGVFLADAGKVVTVLAENLEKAQSPFAALIRIVEQRGHLASYAA